MFSRPLKLVRLAGLLACALAAVYSAVWSFYQPSSGEPGSWVRYAARSLPWSVATTLELVVIAVLGLALSHATQEKRMRRPGPWGWVLLATQSVLALLVAPELLYVVATEASFLLRSRRGLAWIAGQSVAEVLSYYVQTQVTGANPYINFASAQNIPFGISLTLVAAGSLTWNFLAFSLGLLAASESQQRQALLKTNAELTRANAELLAAQRMETEAARMAERLAIARDLHDAVGHHLASLSVNLQLATKLVTGAGQQPVTEAYMVARVLLNDVRTVVSDLRNADAVDLRGVLETMAGNISSPRIELAVHESAGQVEARVAYTLFRCAQEMVTNAIRHAGARTLQLCLSRSTEGAYVLSATDDGRGVLEIKLGNGLVGMRERLEEIGGSLSMASREGQGFTVQATVPNRVAA